VRLDGLSLCHALQSLVVISNLRLIILITKLFMVPIIFFLVFFFQTLSFQSVDRFENISLVVFLRLSQIMNQQMVVEHALTEFIKKSQVKHDLILNRSCILRYSPSRGQAYTASVRPRGNRVSIIHTSGFIIVFHPINFLQIPLELFKRVLCPRLRQYLL
jgi:hypothetical protein